MAGTHLCKVDKRLAELVALRDRDTPERDGHLGGESLGAFALEVREQERVEVAEIGRGRGGRVEDRVV